jgi:hypothetical protein
MPYNLESHSLETLRKIAMSVPWQIISKKHIKIPGVKNDRYIVVVGNDTEPEFIHEGVRYRL